MILRVLFSVLLISPGSRGNQAFGQWMAGMAPNAASDQVLEPKAPIFSHPPGRREIDPALTLRADEQDGPAERPDEAPQS